MLLTLLYHRVNKKKKHSNCAQIFERHLELLHKEFPILLPGEKQNVFTTQICLSFDDAYFDFYHYVFPLLKKFQIRCILGVPVGKILDKATLNTEERLCSLKENYCTWNELFEMQKSSYVKMACHSFSHANLTQKSVDLSKEILEAKTLLEKKLETPIDTFIYPFGKFNREVQKFVKKHYTYIFRIGSSANFSWNQPLLYRIVADDLNEENQITKKAKLPLYLLNYFFNRVRKK